MAERPLPVDRSCPVYPRRSRPSVRAPKGPSSMVIGRLPELPGQGSMHLNGRPIRRSTPTPWPKHGSKHLQTNQHPCKAKQHASMVANVCLGCGAVDASSAPLPIHSAPADMRSWTISVLPRSPAQTMAG
eukprot:236760-Heterocapsa_arctica.AAC.1